LFDVNGFSMSCFSLTLQYHLIKKNHEKKYQAAVPASQNIDTLYYKPLPKRCYFLLAGQAEIC